MAGLASPTPSRRPGAIPEVQLSGDRNAVHHGVRARMRSILIAISRPLWRGCDVAGEGLFVPSWTRYLKRRRRRSHARTSSSVPLFDFVSHAGRLFGHMWTTQKPRLAKASRGWASDKDRSGNDRLTRNMPAAQIGLFSLMSVTERDVRAGGPGCHARGRHWSGQ
jgi:hypothetical protein